MRAPTQSVFLLRFSSVSDLLIPIVNNMKISVNQSTKYAQFTVKKMRTNFYTIIVNSEDLVACEKLC
jgi:hypothetical protein